MKSFTVKIAKIFAPGQLDYPFQNAPPRVGPRLVVPKWCLPIGRIAIPIAPMADPAARSGRGRARPRRADRGRVYPKTPRPVHRPARYAL